MEVAVAVVSWNTRELLCRCLHSLRSDHAAGRADVWVLDNASHDGSAAMVAETFPWVHLIASDDNVGFGAAVNRIVAAVDARAAAGGLAPAWIAPANADVAVTPAAIEALLSAGARHPRAGILAPRLRLPDGSFQHSVHPFPGLGVAAAVDLGLVRLLPCLGERLTLDGRWDTDAPRAVDWAHGAFLLVRREAWRAVGGFDPEQFLYAEDLDLAWRARRAGHPTRYVPEAVVEHAHSAAIDQLYGEARDLRAQEAAHRWLARRRGAAVARTVAGLAVLGSLGRILIALPGAIGGDRDRRLAIWRARRALRVHLRGVAVRRSAAVAAPRRRRER